jgi:SAM-dependent methyltransferase
VEKVTDWAQLWRELVEATAEREKSCIAKAERGARNLNRRWAKADSTRDFIVAQLDANPGATLVDIGAGTGRWSMMLAHHARHVTAIDSSPLMIQAMQENLRAENIDNVRIVEGTWPQIQIEPHDFSFCSHAMYASHDLPAFIRGMAQVTRRMCFLLMRATTSDGIMAEAAMHLWGHPYDSPNFQVGYNVLLQMGIFPNVMIADTGLWEPWTSPSLDAALVDIKRRMGLSQTNAHDDFLMDLLRRRLQFVDDKYVWTPSVRSVLVYWNIDQ